MDLIGHITEAAVDPGHWPVFLEALEQYYPGARMILFGHENGSPTAAMSFSRNYPEDDQRAYTQYFVHNSPYVTRGLQQLPVGKARLSEAVISNRELEMTEHYNDFLKPRRLGHHAAGVIIERNARRCVSLSLADQKDDGDRRIRQLRLLDLLTPHIARAFRLNAVLDAERRQNQAARRVFESWAHAAIVFSSDGQVLTMNRAAQELLLERKGLSLTREGRLRCGDEAVNRRLDNAIHCCAAGPRGTHNRDIDGLALPRLGNPPLNARLSPLPDASEMGGPEGGAVLMVLADPDTVHTAPIDWIAGRYRLAPAEARLTELLVGGADLSDSADRLGIQLSTARSRLKTIQAKTDCRRQADLVRLAFSMPPMRA